MMKTTFNNYIDNIIFFDNRPIGSFCTVTTRTNKEKGLLLYNSTK